MLAKPKPALRMPRVPPWCGSLPLDGPRRDWFTRSGCEQMCKIIVGAWQRAGYHNVTAKPKRIDLPQKEQRGTVYAVETNLIGGLPPRSA